MKSNEVKEKYNDPNPFLTPMADALWEKLDKGGKPVSKEELRRRIDELKKNKKP